MKEKKADRRIERTRKLLREALVDLILEKGYDRITVQNIIDRANVGRSTFYDHFEDKDNLMASSLERLQTELGEDFASGDFGDARDVMLPSLALFKHAQGQHHLYKAMLGGRGIELVESAVREGLSVHARAHFEQVEQAGKRLTVPMETLITHLVGSLQTLLSWWLDNEMPYSPEEMNEIFLRLVRGGIESVFEDL